MPEELKNNDEKLFVIGIICFFLAFGFTLFALYIVPFLIWGLHYDVPEFVAHLVAALQDSYNYSLSSSKFIVWLLFLIPGLIAGYIAYYISNLLDEKKM